MKKLNLIGLSLMTVGLLVGCGSSGGTTNDKNTIGTGYYVDSAVQGINYSCGTQTGITDKNGKFIFEKVNGCTFSLAGITLRTTSSKELVDGKDIFENNPKVAKFLQSIDSDNNLTNGIQITDAVLKSLTKALNENNSKGKLPEDAVLENVVSTVGNEVDGVTGEVRTDDQVQKHLTQTQTKITKEIFIGKTFYVSYTENDVNIVEKHTINADATHDTWEQVFGQSNSGTDTISISGDIVTFSDDNNNDDITRFSILEVTDKYMKTKHAVDGEIEKLYFSLEDAKATFDSAGSSTTFPLSDLIVGKTFYQHCKDGGGDDGISTITFNTNGKVVTVDFGHPTTSEYRIEGNKVYAIEDGVEEAHTLLKQTTDSIMFQDKDGTTSTFYFDRAKAEISVADDCSNNS